MRSACCGGSGAVCDRSRGVLGQRGDGRGKRERERASDREGREGCAKDAKGIQKSGGVRTTLASGIRAVAHQLRMGGGPWLVLPRAWLVHAPHQSFSSFAPFARPSR